MYQKSSWHLCFFFRDVKQAINKQWGLSRLRSFMLASYRKTTMFQILTRTLACSRKNPGMCFYILYIYIYLYVYYTLYITYYKFYPYIYIYIYIYRYQKYIDIYHIYIHLIYIYIVVSNVLLSNCKYGCHGVESRPVSLLLVGTPFAITLLMAWAKVQAT